MQEDFYTHINDYYNPAEAAGQNQQWKNVQEGFQKVNEKNDEQDETDTDQTERIENIENFMSNSLLSLGVQNAKAYQFNAKTWSRPIRIGISSYADEMIEKLSNIPDNITKIPILYQIALGTETGLLVQPYFIYNYNENNYIRYDNYIPRSWIKNKYITEIGIIAYNATDDDITVDPYYMFFRFFIGFDVI